MIMKKVSALLLSMAMILSLAACGANSETGGQTQTPEATPVQQTEQPTATPEPEPEYDFGGMTLKIGWFSDNGGPDPEANALSEAYYNRIKEVESTYNCKIEFVNCTGDYYNKYVTSVLAGDPIVDIGYLMTFHVPALAEGGIIQPLNNYDAYDVNAYKWRGDVTEAGNYKGNYYVTLLKNYEVRYGIFWNKTLFEKYGLPDLYDLYSKNEWNWSKLKEIALQGNQDTDKDGVIDIYGFNARESLEWCYLYSNEANVVKKTSNGLSIDLSDSKVIEAMTALQDFTTTVQFRNAIDWSTESWDAFITGFRDGKYMMTLEESWISGSYLEKDEGGMVDDWGWVPFPKGVSASDYSCYGKEFGCYAMLNGIDKPQEKALIYNLITDFTQSEEELSELVYAELENWGRDANAVENANEILNKGVSIVNPIKGFDSVNKAVSSMFGDITKGTSTPQTAIEAYQSQIDMAIADISTHDYDADMKAIVEAAEAEATEAPKN